MDPRQQGTPAGETGQTIDPRRQGTPAGEIESGCRGRNLLGGHS